MVDKDVILTVADSKSKAQDGRKVTGKVTDSRGEAIIGVNVLKRELQMGRLQILAETIVLMFLLELYWCFHISGMSLKMY